MTMFCSMLKVITLGLAALLCFEGPRWRKQERFVMVESATVRDGETSIPLELIGASIVGCKLAIPATAHVIFRNDKTSLTVQGVGRVRIQAVRQHHGHRAATFEYSSTAQRHAMVCKLFSGRYGTVAPSCSSTHQLMSSLWGKRFHG